jgi:competence protein ComEC
VLFDPVLPDGTVVSRPTPRSWWAFAAVALGLCLGRWGGVSSIVWFSLAAGCAAIAATARGRLCHVALFVAAALLGAGWFTARLTEGPADSIARMTAAGRSVVRLEGVVLQTPRRVERDDDPLTPPGREGGWRLNVSIRAVDGVGAASGRVWVRAGDSFKELPARAGDRVTIEGLFSPIEAPMNPGEMDRRLWAGQEGYVGFIKAVEIKPVAAEGPWQEGEAGLLAARAWMSDRAHTLLLGDTRERGSPDAQGRALLAALILGDEEPALREARGAFNRLGLAHVLSISGFHLAVLAAVALFALRALGDLGWREPVMVAALILAYLAVLPFNAPVWRSGLMVVGLLAADAAGRRYDRLAILGWIAVGLLIWRPMDLWSLGFQLSFGLVTILIWMGSETDARLWGRPLRGTVPAAPRWWALPAGHARTLVSTNLLCCIAAMPLVMYQTGLVSVLSVASGVLVVPLITVLLILGYAGAAIGVLIPGTTGFVTPLLADLATAVAWLVEKIDQTPWSSFRSPPVSALWAAVATATALYWFSRGYRRDPVAWALLAVVAIWGAAEITLGLAVPRAVAVRLDTLAVGDGTCHLVRSGRDALLWDCGSLTPGVGRMLVPRAARALGAWRVPTAVVTHPNLDHFNGLLDVVEPLGIRLVLVGEAFTQHAAEHPRSGEAFTISELRRRGVEVRVVHAGDRFPLGSETLEFVSPPRGAAWSLDNDLSLVATISDGGRDRLLLCGDIQDQAMDWILAQHPRLHTPAMEAPHHGSARDAAYSFVESINPRLVVQSTGPSRAGDSRWDAVRAGRAWRCTATEGAVWTQVLRDGSVSSGISR